MPLRSRGLRLVGAFLLVGLVAPSLGAQVGPAQQSPRRSATGQPLLSISGRVFEEESNEALEGARVVLETFTGSYLQEIYVDSTGRFMFAGLGRGNYYVRASSPGHIEKREQVQVISGPVGGVFIYLLRKQETRMPLLLEPVDVSEQLIPKKARKEYKKGVEAIRDREVEKALKHFQQAIEIHPEYVSAWHALGILRLRLGQAQEAQASFERAVEINPSSAPPRVMLGVLFNAAHRYPDAREHLEHAIQLNPASWLARFELSRACWAQGDVSAAEEHITRAHELNQRIPQVHLMRANVYLVRKDYRAVVGEFDEFLALVPQGAMAENVRQRKTQLEEHLERTEAP